MDEEGLFIHRKLSRHQDRAGLARIEEEEEEIEPLCSQEHHQNSPTGSIQCSEASYFRRNKHRNGVLSWALRLLGLFLCCVGGLILGQGFMHAVYYANESGRTNSRC